MPAAAGFETGFARPAVKVGVSYCGQGVAPRGKEKADVRAAVEFADAQRPVLVVLGESGIAGAAFADDIHIFVVLHVGYVDPRFKRDRVAVGKGEGAVRGGFGERIMRAAAVEFDGGVLGFEVGKFRRARTGDIAVHAAVRFETRGLLGSKIPARDAFGATSGRMQGGDGGDESE